MAPSRRSFSPRADRIVDERAQLGPGVQEAHQARHELGILLEQRSLEHRHRAERQQPDHRAHLETLGAAVGQTQHVVEEAVLLVPHPGIVTGVDHRRGDPQIVLDELERHVSVGGLRQCQLRADLQHVLAEERHPCGSVRLLEIPAGWQRRTAIEDADVVEPEEAAFEHVAAGAVLAVDPPREVQQQFMKRALEPIEIALRRTGSAPVDR